MLNSTEHKHLSDADKYLNFNNYQHDKYSIWEFESKKSLYFSAF